MVTFNPSNQNQPKSVLVFHNPFFPGIEAVLNIILCGLTSSLPSSAPFLPGTQWASPRCIQIPATYPEPRERRGVLGANVCGMCVHVCCVCTKYETITSSRGRSILQPTCLGSFGEEGRVGQNSLL